MAAGDPGVLKRNFSATAIQTTLVNSISSAATGDTTTSVAVVSVSGFPSTVPYTLILDPDGSKEEVVTVTAASSTTLTITRGQDNTPAVSHAAGTSVRHGVSGRDFKEEQTHIAARGYDIDTAILSSAGQTHVHGLQTGDGSVVGSTQAVTLTRKTLGTGTSISSTIDNSSGTISGGTVTSAVITTSTVTASTVRSSTLTNDTLGSDLAAGGYKVTGLGTPTSSGDSATKGYVDGLITTNAAYATAAATSATSAATSASSAATSATSAAASVSTIASYATAAATSATSAATSATSAATSASSAATSATASASSASASATSATASASSASASATSATAAATSATSAAASATAAATSATSAAASATTASNSAATATTQAGNASASATAAATSATSAAASATAAATSAASAAASATTAAGYVPSLTGNSGKYLTTDGTSTSWGTVQALPTQTGNSGKYLSTDGSTASWSAISGSLAQPTEPSSPTDGLIWVDTDGTAVGNQVLRWSKAVANGTTTLSGNDDNSVPLSYVAGYEQVYQNGVLLARGSDYTATNGSSITLTNASVTGDIFEVFASLPVAITDVYTQTQANAAFIPKTLTTTTGDIIYASGANTPARLGIGTTGQVLTVSGGVPAWTTPASGSMTLLSTTTLGATTTTVSSISQSYKHLYIEILGIDTSNFNPTINYQTNSTGIAWNVTQAAAATGVNYYNTSGTVGNAQNYGGNYGSGTNKAAMFIYDYTDAVNPKVGTFIQRWINEGGSPILFNGQLVANHTAAVTSFSMVVSTGSYDGGTIKIYGVN